MKIVFKYIVPEKAGGERVENLKKKVQEEIDKAVIKQRKVGLIAADLQKLTGEKVTVIQSALNQLKGAQALIESKFGRMRVYSPGEMVELYIKRKKGASFEE